MAEEKNAKLAEYGRALTETINSEGWPLILDIMEKMVIQAEADLIEYRGSETNSLLSLQKRALAYRTLYQNLQAKVKVEIEHAAQEPPQTTQEPMAGVDESRAKAVLMGIYDLVAGNQTQDVGPAY